MDMFDLLLIGLVNGTCTGKPHYLNGKKKHGFRSRFPLKPIQWLIYSKPSTIVHHNYIAILGSNLCLPALPGIHGEDFEERHGSPERSHVFLEVTGNWKNVWPKKHSDPLMRILGPISWWRWMTNERSWLTKDASADAIDVDLSTQRV